MSTAETLAPVRAESIIRKPVAISFARIVVAVGALAAFWIFSFWSDQHEMSMLGHFLPRMGANLALLLFFLGWWFTNRRMTRAERWLDFAVMLAGYVAIALLADPSVGFFGLLLSGLAPVITVGTAWLVVNRWIPVLLQRRCLWAVLCVAWAAYLPFRFDGLYGNQRSQFSWRWSPTAEQLFLAEKAHANTAPSGIRQPADAEKPLTLRPGDWPRFRGPEGDGQVHGLVIATDWDKHPPKELWRQRVGPAWSSMTIVDHRLFTQEQRGDREAVVCYDPATGTELWAHLDEGRFAENLSGTGPRATPIFAGGRLYTLGGFGLANCLDPGTGRTIWSRSIYAPAAGAKKNAAADSSAAVPQWGVSNSPLVIGGTVFFFAGAQPDKGLQAYSAKSGKPKWTAATGKNSYASPEMFSIYGDPLVLMLTNSGLTAVDSASGHIAWEYSIHGGEMFSPIDQPQPVGDGRILLSTPAGIALIQLSQQDGRSVARQVWESNKLKPSLNDFVVQDGAIYGFDDGIFCAIDLNTGKRRWKAGRYGHGQVLLLADQKLLLVVSENGEVVLVSANEEHRELARFQTISGKTWNHPVVAHGRLFVRNAEEMACYELPLDGDSSVATN